ncbi:hypothetical protein ACFLZH_02115 [Patescibacteria group bacterium]
MDQDLSPDELKLKLEQLIESSEALKTISEEERNERIELMMAASPEDMAEYITVFEEEFESIKEIEEDQEKREDEAIETKIKEERSKRLEAEKKTKAGDIKAIDNLLQELDKVETGKAPTVEEKPESFILKIAKELLAIMIGLFGCALISVIIVFTVILSIGDLSQIDVIFNKSPLIMFNGYLVAAVFGSLLGFFIMLYLRLFKKQGFIISVFMSVIIGGGILWAAYSGLTLNYEFEVYLNSQPVEIPGYWIAGVFAVLMGIFSQIFNRIINVIPFFKKSRKKEKA